MSEELINNIKIEVKKLDYSNSFRLGVQISSSIICNRITNKSPRCKYIGN